MRNIYLLKQQGAIMLTTVTLLLLLTSTITLYSAKVSMVKHRIGLNTQNRAIAENMATIGNFQMLSLLSEQPQKTFNQQTSVIDGKGQYSSTMLASLSDRFSHKMRIIEVNSTGKSENDLASVNVSQHVISYPLIRTLPSAPLVVRKSISIENKLVLVANPNGAGKGLPVSLWTSQTINLGILNLFTCQQYEDEQDNCELSPLSYNQQRGMDIIDSPDLFPQDIFAYLTNLPVDYRSQLLDEADTVVSHCEDLNQLSRGLIWIQGNCEIQTQTTIGTIADPVILVVDDGDLAFSENAGVIGMVLMLTPFESIIAANVNVNGKALIKGAMIASESVSFNKLPLKIDYDANVLENLRQNSNNWRIANVPNSWRNF